MRLQLKLSCRLSLHLGDFLPSLTKTFEERLIQSQSSHPHIRDTQVMMFRSYLPSDVTQIDNPLLVTLFFVTGFCVLAPSLLHPFIHFIYLYSTPCRSLSLVSIFTNFKSIGVTWQQINSSNVGNKLLLPTA